MDKQEILGRIAKSLGKSAEDFESLRLDEVDADIFTLKYDRRGLGGIIIGDDGSSLVCGSIYSIEHYIEEFKNGKRDKIDSEGQT